MHTKQGDVDELVTLYQLIERDRVHIESTVPAPLYDAIYHTQTHENRFSSILRFEKQTNVDIDIENEEEKKKQSADDDEIDDPLRKGSMLSMYMQLQQHHQQRNEVKSAKLESAVNDGNLFGHRFYYSKKERFSESNDVHNVGGYKTKQWWVQMDEHESLKQQILTLIELAQWEEVYEKARSYVNTEKCQKMKAERGWNASDIAPHSTITVEHIATMMLYTNFAHIERALHATYHRLHGGKESDDALKQRHARLAKLARCLSECVQCFGNECLRSDKIAYFHVINKAISMPPAMCYHAPLSATTSKMVALHVLYSYHKQSGETDGLLVEIAGHRKSKHFECQWLSDYPNECERLFMHCRREIYVQNVIDIACGVNYSFYLSAFHILRSMLNGDDLSKLNTSMNFEVDPLDVEKERAFNAIYSFLYQQFYGRSRPNALSQSASTAERLPTYIDELLRAYFDELKEINISWNYLTTARRKLTSSWSSATTHLRAKSASNQKKKTFFVRMLAMIQPFIVYFECDWIKWHLLIHAFRNLQTITVHSIKLHRSIFEDCLIQIKQQHKKHMSSSYPLQRIVLKDAKQFELAFADVHEKYNNSFKALQWELANPRHDVFEIRRVDAK